MPKSSELSKAKEMPAGYHYHPGYGYSHPINQPHRPGSKADAWHKAHGVANAWFEQHGTTREQYEEENGGTEGSEGEPTEKPTSGDKDYSKVEFSGVMQWDCEKEVKDTFEEEYRKIDVLQSKLDKYKGKNMTNSELYHRVFDDYMKEQGIEVKIPPRYFNELKKEVASDLFQSIIDSAKECPFGASAIGNIECFRDPKFNKEIMHFNCDKRQRGFGFGLNMRYLDGRENDTAPQKTIWVRKDGKVVEENILDADGNPTEWGFHFDDKSSYPQSIIHEYGHALDYAIGSMIMMAQSKYEASVINEDYQKLVKEINIEVADSGKGTRIGYTELDRSYGFFEESGKRFEKEHGLTKLNTRRLYINHETFNANKERINEFMESKGLEYIGPVSEDGSNHIYYKVKEHDIALTEGQVNDLKKKGAGLCGEHRSGLSDYVNENTVRRVEECEEMYKKLYNVDTIDPTMVYSGYGFSGISMMMPDTDVDSKGEYFKQRACKERMAEAYQDVIVRKDRSNSMSRLLYAHTQYEILQLTKGYKGTFEDFINDKIGRERFAERIVKSTLRTLDQRYIDHVRKSLESDRNDTIRKHQAFIMSISKQFDNRLAKSGLTQVGVIRREQNGEEWLLIDGYSHAKTLRGVKSDIKATLMQYSPKEAQALDWADGDSWIVPQSEAYNDGEYKGYYMDVEEVHEGLWYIHAFVSVH